MKIQLKQLSVIAFFMLLTSIDLFSQNNDTCVIYGVVMDVVSMKCLNDSYTLDYLTNREKQSINFFKDEYKLLFDGKIVIGTENEWRLHEHLFKGNVSIIGNCSVVLELSCNSMDRILTLRSKKIYFNGIEKESYSVFLSKADFSNDSILKNKISELVKKSFIDTIKPPPIPDANELQFLDFANAGYEIRNSSGRKLSISEVRGMLANYPDALSYYEQGRGRRISGYACMVTGLIFDVGALTCAIMMSNSNDNDEFGRDDWMEAGLISFGAGALCLIPEYVLLNSGKKDIKKAVNMYNNSIYNKKTSDISLKFGATRSGGIGFTLNF